MIIHPGRLRMKTTVVACQVWRGSCCPSPLPLSLSHRHICSSFFVTKSVGGQGKSQYNRFLAARGRAVTSRAPCHLTSTGHSPHVTGCHALVTGNHSERCAGRAARPRLLSKADGSKGAGKQLTILCGLISNWLCRRRRMLASSVGARQHAGL